MSPYQGRTIDWFGHRSSRPEPAADKAFIHYCYRIVGHRHTTRVSPAPPRAVNISQMCM